MRERLKDFDWFTYGLSFEDFYYTIGIVKRMIEARYLIFKQDYAETKKKYPDDVADLMDDVAFYIDLDNRFMWEFCLWRLQGIFEGIITTIYLSHLNEKKLNSLVGLKSKLDQMLAEGYIICQEDYDELLNWGKLRNALSHKPPEQFRPAFLDEDDINEYVSLVTRLIESWENSVHDQ